MLRAFLFLCLAAPGLSEDAKCISDARLGAIDKTAMLENSSHDAKIPELKKIYYINLKKSQFRRGRVQHLFTQTSNGVPVERFEAISRGIAREYDLAEFTTHGIHPYMKDVYKGESMWGTVGVYLSHAKLLKKILEENPDSNDMFLILEDDAIPQNDWRAKLEKVMPDVPSDWDMIRIGYGTDSNLRCEDKVTNDIYENREPTRTADGKHGFYTGNQAYLVRPSSIPKILAQLSTLPVLDVDGTMISRQGGMRVYGVADPLVAHGNGLGLSNRLNPFSLAQVDSQETVKPMSLAQVIDESVESKPAEPQETTLNEKAFEMFAEDLP